MNRWFGFDARAQRYRTLISEARILATEAKNSCISAPNVVRRLRKPLTTEPPPFYCGDVPSGTTAEEKPVDRTEPRPRERFFRTLLVVTSE